MSERFDYKGKDYRVDDKGKIHEDKFFGIDVGEKDKDGNIKIKTGFFTEEQGRISSTGKVYEKGWFGSDKEEVGKEKGCLLSSACVAARGLPDDCSELTTLRNFRKDHLEETPQGNLILQEYQDIGGKILHWIEGQAERVVLYDDLYQRLVKGTVNLIQSEQFEAAIDYYRSIVREYQAKARL